MSLRTLLSHGLAAAAPAAVMAVPRHHSSGAATVTVTETVTAVPSCSGLSSTVTTTSAASSNTVPTTTLVATATATGYGLNDAAKDAGKLYFGTAADIPGTGEKDDPYYMAQFNNTHDFGQATPANIMKFMFTEPEQGVFNFTGGDAFLDLAEATGKRVRCHNLVWYNQLPDWVTSPAVNWTSETLTSVIQDHAYALVSHFGDRCYAWDVVNEALSDSPAGAWQSNIFYDTIGPEYFFTAFEAAARAVSDNDLSVKLYYNDYNIESPGNKSAAAQGLVAELQARGIQVDGVGLESHFVVGSTPSRDEQEANMRAFVDLGVEVAVTELDVRLVLPGNETTQAQQVEDFYGTVAACVSVDGCVGVTLWDFVDTYSWIPSTFAGEGYGTPWLQPDGANTPLVKKAVYDGILEALTGEAEAL